MHDLLLLGLFVAGDGLAHGGIRLDVAHPVEIHDAEIALTECVGHRERHLGFGLDDFRLHFLRARLHLRLERDGGGAADLGVSLRHALVGLGLVELQTGADVLADIHVGDVNGENLERGARVEALFERGLADALRVFQNVLVGVGGTDGGDDAFADARDDGFLGRASDEPVEVRADGDARLDLELDAVLGDAVNGGAAAACAGAVNLARNGD